MKFVGLIRITAILMVVSLFEKVTAQDPDVLGDTVVTTAANATEQLVQNVTQDLTLNETLNSTIELANTTTTVHAGDIFSAVEKACTN